MFFYRNKKKIYHCVIMHTIKNNNKTTYLLKLNY